MNELTMMNSFVDQKIGFPVYDAAMFIDNVTSNQTKSSKNEEPSKQPSIISVESESEIIHMEVEKEFQKYQAVKRSRQEDKGQTNKVVLQPAKFIAPETFPSRAANFSRVNQLFSDSEPESELQPLPPPEQHSNAISKNDVKDMAHDSSKELPKINQNPQRTAEMVANKNEPIIEARSISSDDGFDPTSARMKIPATNGPIQKPAFPFGINRSPKKPVNFSSGRGRPLERPGGLKPLTASSLAQKQRLKRNRPHTKIIRPKHEKENTKPLARARTPSPKRK